MQVQHSKQYDWTVLLLYCREYYVDFLSLSSTVRRVVEPCLMWIYCHAHPAQGRANGERRLRIWETVSVCLYVVYACLAPRRHTQTRCLRNLGAVTQLYDIHNLYEYD